MATDSDIIDVNRLLDLRPAGVRNHLYADEDLLPLSPGVLLTALGAPLVEIPVTLGPLLEAAFRAAAGKDAPLCIGLDAEAGPGEPGPRALHASVEKALQAARAASYRLPFVLHARLGLVDADEEQSIDAARIKVLEALDAGVTSLQLGVFGDVEAAAKLLKDVLAPVEQNGLGVVVTLADGYQVEQLPGMLAPLDVHAYGTNNVKLPRREAVIAKPSAPFPSWADASSVVIGAVKAALKDGATVENIPEAQRDRVEMKLFGALEDLIVALKAKGSAGHAMVNLSSTKEAWPIPE